MLVQWICFSLLSTMVIPDAQGSFFLRVGDDPFAGTNESVGARILSGVPVSRGASGSARASASATGASASARAPVLSRAQSSANVNVSATAYDSSGINDAARAPASKSRGHNQHADRFFITKGTQQTFEDARKTCGEGKYLLNLDGTMNVDHIRASLQDVGLQSSVVWLNARQIAGFYHWLDPMPQLVVQKNLTGYGQVMEDAGAMNDCVVLEVLTGKLSTSDCSNKQDFVCIEDTQLKPLFHSSEHVSVALRTNRPPILQSYQLPDLTLTCRAAFTNGSAFMEAIRGSYAYAYVWTKNDVYLNESFRSIQPEKVIERTTFSHSYASSQGHYRCGLKALPSGSTVWSNTVTVVLEDFLTYRMSGRPSVEVGNIFYVGTRLEAFAQTINLAAQKDPQLSSWSYSGAKV